VLNPNTGHVSPQFHVRFDDVFETVKGTIDALHGRWKTLCGFTSSDISTSENNGKTDTKNKKEHSERTNRSDQRSRKTTPTDDIEDFGTFGSSSNENRDTLSQNEGEPFQNKGDPFQNEGATEHTVDEGEQSQAEATPSHNRRSTQTWKPTRSYLESIQQEDLALACIPCCMEAINYSTQEEETIECPISLMAKTDQDTMYWGQAMKQLDAQQILEAALDEIRTHEVNKHWEVIPVNQLPDGTPVLDPVWSMKRKRRLRTNEGLQAQS
jgi:hypothetical protein